MLSPPHNNLLVKSFQPSGTSRGGRDNRYLKRAEGGLGTEFRSLWGLEHLDGIPLVDPAPIDQSDA